MAILLALASCEEAPTDVKPGPKSLASHSPIGVAECDEYVKRYDACLAGNLPHITRVELTALLHGDVVTIHLLAKRPDSRSYLSQLCRERREKARSRLSAYGCEL